MAKRKKKLSPEDAAARAAFEARSAENLRRLRELTEHGWAELTAKREAARRGEIELHPAWDTPPKGA
jgi:hypothetical protein